MGYERVIQTLTRPARPALRIITVLALLAVGVFTVMTVAAQDENAMIRVFHGSPDAGPVDIYLDGEATLEGVEFTDASDYMEVPAGEHQVQVVPAGEDASAAVIDETVTIEAGMNYTIAAIGSAASVQALILNDESGMPDEGTAHVRAVHAIEGGPAVNIQTADGEPVFEGAEFGDATGYTPVPAGSVDLQVVPADGGDPIIDAAGVELEDGEIYTIFAVPTEDGDGGQPVILTDMAMQMAGGTPAASPAASPAGGTPLATTATGTGGGAATTATTTGGAVTTATTTGDAVMTPTGTGGGQPGMPTTGGGGMADGGASWALIAAITVLATAIVGGSAMLATRRTRP